jgi:broad-specificity NMP kinase
MTNNTPDILIIRGAPGTGKSSVAKCLEGYFPKGIKIEVDVLRAMVISVDWKNQGEHISVLSASIGLANSFLGLGYGPVIIVDTFSGDKLSGYLTELAVLEVPPSVRSFALITSPEELRRRVENRPDGQFKEIDICQKLNADTLRHLLPLDQLIDNTALTPEGTARIILETLA